MLIPLGTVLVDTRHVAPEQTVEVLDRDGVNVTYGAFLVAVAYEAIFGKVLVQAGILLGIIHHHAHFGQPVHLGSRDKVDRSGNDLARLTQDIPVRRGFHPVRCRNGGARLTERS